MAAAMEGAVNHIPSIGFSLLDFNPGCRFYGFEAGGPGGNSDGTGKRIT